MGSMPLGLRSYLAFVLCFNLFAPAAFFDLFTDKSAMEKIAVSAFQFPRTTQMLADATTAVKNVTVDGLNETSYAEIKKLVEYDAPLRRYNADKRVHEMLDVCAKVHNKFSFEVPPRCCATAYQEHAEQLRRKRVA